MVPIGQENIPVAAADPQLPIPIHLMGYRLEILTGKVLREFMFALCLRIIMIASTKLQNSWNQLDTESVFPNRRSIVYRSPYQSGIPPYPPAQDVLSGCVVPLLNQESLANFEC